MFTRRNTRTLPLASALVASLGMVACSPEPAGDDELPAPEISGTPDPVTGAEIDEAVPGVEDAEPQGATPNDADIADEENLDTTQPGEPEDPRP